MYNAAVLTISDSGYAGLREDAGGPAVMAFLREHGYVLAHYVVLPDEENIIAGEIRRVCDTGLASLVLTTGGTGFSPRDVTPEATLMVLERLCPGIPEAMRAFSMTVTKRAVLSRAVAGLRGRSLIVNLPGSPRAARECLEAVADVLGHGLDILTGRDKECAR